MRPTLRDASIALAGQRARPVEETKPGRSNRTLTSDLFQRLRTDILHCNLRPNSRLLFRDLRASYTSGMSPLREALMRLASDGLVILEDHKGFRVAPVSREELVDIASTRCEVEGRAFEMSILKGDDHWEATILARFHELSKRPTYVVSGALDYEWERRHDAFHQSLYAASGLTWMTNFCQVLAERAFRYRHLLLEVVDRTRDHRSEHEAIQQAALGREAGTAVRLLKDHYMRTVQTLLDNWTELN
jgi:GntR family carbon starvation induced transcriptional regulator